MFLVKPCEYIKRIIGKEEIDMKRKLTVKEMVCGGLFGLPVFAAGGGIGYIVRPSFGYLIGFVVAAFVTSFVVERSPRNSFRKYLCAAS